MSEYEKGVWYSWGIDGDKEPYFPVPEGTLVTVLHRDGEVFHNVRTGRDEAGEWWVDENDPQPGDIMFFRVEK